MPMPRMNPILVAVLTSLFVGGASCSGARSSGKPPEAAARHVARGDSPWLDDPPSRRVASDEVAATKSGDESESSEDGGDDLGDEGSDDLGDEGSDDTSGEEGSESSIDFGDEGWGGEEDWGDEEDQGNV